VLKFDDQTAEKVAPLYKCAVAAQIEAVKAIAAMEELIAGAPCREEDRRLVEDMLNQAVLDAACDSETAEGFGIDDAKQLLEEVREILE